MSDTGWLKQVLENAKNEVERWPAWMQDQDPSELDDLDYIEGEEI